MRRSHRGRRAVAAAVGVIALVAGAGARAADPSPLWIMQDGNGKGQTAPLIEGFNVRTVLFNGSRFPLNNGQTQRPHLKKYLAFGTLLEPNPIPADQILARVAMSTSDDGATWTDPIGITVKDPNGIPVPLIVNDPTDHFDVAFGNLPQFFGNGPEHFNFQFAIYYRDHLAPTTDPSSIHVAISADAIDFELDQSIAEGNSPILPPGVATFGPTQVIYQAGGSSSCAATDGNFPWNCRAIMLHTRNDGMERMAIAGSGDGLTFNGRATPILEPGPAESWDDRSVSLAKIQRQPDNSYVMYYSGHRTEESGQCFGGLSGCFSLGVAVSTDGLNFIKAAHNPVTPRALFEDAVALPGDLSNASLWYPTPVKDGHGRVFLSVIRGNELVAPEDLRRDFWLARITEAPGQEPQIRIDNPIPPFTAPNELDLVAYVTDTLGTNIGVNLATLAVTINGQPIAGVGAEVSIVGALTHRAYKVTRENIFADLNDGTHILILSVADLDGNVASKSIEFVLDRTPPETAITSPAPEMVVGVPLLESLGTFVGDTTDELNPLFQLKAVVTNPIGLQKVYEIRKVGAQFSSPRNGFVILSEHDGGRTWNWKWIAPTLDLHLALPGPYSIQFLGVDSNGNTEQPDTDNTASVLLI